MGRNDRLTRDEAAEMLGVGRRQFRRILDAGSLHPMEGGKELFRAEEVAGLLEARLKQHDLASITIVALQALALARSQAKRLDEVGTILGFDVAQLPMDPDNVTSTYVRAVEAARSTEMTMDDVLEWARILRSVDENYLKMVAEYTADPEPWQPFYSLAMHLLELIGGKGPVVIVRAAADTVRQVSYFYVRKAIGPRAAESMFPEGDVNEQLLMHLTAVNPDSQRR